MIKQVQIGKSWVTIVGKTAAEIDEKIEAYKKKKGVLQEDQPVKRKRRTKAELEAEKAESATEE